MKIKLSLIGLFVLLTTGFLSAQTADTVLIKGTVTDSASNLPLNQAKVKVLFTFGIGGSTTVDSAFTNASGAFVLPDVPISRFGSTSVQASKSGYVTKSSAVASNPPDTLTKDFLLASSGAVDETTRVSGAITDSVTHDSIAGAYVAIYTISFGPGGLSIDTLGYALTNAQGTYLIKLITDLTSVTVSSYASGYYTKTTQNVTLQPATTLNIALSPNVGNGKLLRGVVTDTASGLPLLNAIVSAYNTTSMFYQNDSTDTQGRYAIIGIPANINNLTVGVSRSGYVTKNLGSISVSADTTTLNAQLRSTVSITARHAALTGDASGITVKVSPQPAASSLTFSGNAQGTVGLMVLSVDGTPVFSGTQATREGRFAFTWNVSSRLPAGAYVYKLTIGDVTEAGSLVLQK
jgi:hypothetical protein